MTKDETIEPNEAATFQGAKVVKKEAIKLRELQKMVFRRKRQPLLKRFESL